jgi:alcohol dehydrogenase (NADP+)
MITANARCTCGPQEPFIATKIRRRDLGPRDVLIDIAYAGICHSDIDHARQLRHGGKTIYPLVPGHEIAGVVSAVGTEVTKFAVGDRAGVGNMVDSCRVCPNCQRGLEQYCTGRRVMTYNSMGRDGEPTYGGYSDKIVVDENFVLRIPHNLQLQNAAPLFCAGISVYSPLRRWKAGPGKRVAIVGFGGLGHVGVKLSHALGAHATVLDLSEAKRKDALNMGAQDYRVTTDPATFIELAGSFDLIISTVPVNVDLDALLGLLALDGTLVNLAIPMNPFSLAAVSLLRNRRSLAGTLSGGISETQEMVDFCAIHGIGAEVEVISVHQIDEAYKRLLAGDVRYRFVIDARTFEET